MADRYNNKLLVGRLTTISIIAAIMEDGMEIPHKYEIRSTIGPGPLPPENIPKQK